MLPAMKPMMGKVITVCGPVDPVALGKVMMHEHLYVNLFNKVDGGIRQAERDLIFSEGIPSIRKCNEHGCHAFVDASWPSVRANAAFYVEASAAANMHIVLCTGFYREIELNSYFVKTPERQIWPFVRQALVEELTELCVREIVEGIGGSTVHAGALKVASSGPVLTPAEDKAFRAVARAQRQTGVHITTHCTQIGAETTQLRLLEKEGVDLNRVLIGHTAGHLMDAACRQTCMDWMRRGASFLPTNLALGANGGEYWRPLVTAIRTIFDAGLGDHLCLGLDCAFCAQQEDMVFRYDNMPPPPWRYMFTETLPAFRRLGLTAEEEELIMGQNPQRILPVQ